MYDNQPKRGEYCMGEDSTMPHGPIGQSLRRHRGTQIGTIDKETPVESVAVLVESPDSRVLAERSSGVGKAVYLIMPVGKGPRDDRQSIRGFPGGGSG